MTFQASLFPCASPAPQFTQEFCEKINAYETDRWAINALLNEEYAQHLNTAKHPKTLRVLDPCYGLGMITRTVKEQCENATVAYGDIINWTDDPQQHIGDFLAPESANWIKQWANEGKTFDCIMNPPFEHSASFIERAIALGARKICVFEKCSFFGSIKRKRFWESAPLTKKLYCGQRANCKRFDLVDKDMSSTTHDHAWFIFEPHKKNPPKHAIIKGIYK